MTDEEFVFRQTERERKRDGRGTFNKVRQGGKHVRFPSDNLSAKEKKQMNGAVQSYSFSRPLGWKQFQSMPRDLRQEYLDMLTDKYVGISNALIGESMGVKNNVFAPYLNRHALKVHRKMDMPRSQFLDTEDGKKWMQWVGQASTQNDEQTVVEDVQEDNIAGGEMSKSVNVQNIAALLQMMQGTGAKLTIEITL